MNLSNHSQKWTIWTLATLSLVASAAFAQEERSSDQLGVDDITVEEITVTGTRLKRISGADQPVPTTVIDVGDIRSGGRAEIADLVNQIPSLFLTQTNQTSSMKEASGQTPGGAGVNALDLRGLGVERTLTLVNGRRRIAGLPGTSAVDLTAISPLLVERIDVITGGASAQYGADAVAGVANFILKDDFDGLEASLRYGDSIRGGMDMYDADLVFGHNFSGDRGNITASLHYSERGEVWGHDRPWIDKGGADWLPDGSGGNVIGSPRHKLDGNVRSLVSLGNEIYTFNDDGTIRPFNFGDELVDFQGQPVVTENLQRWWQVYATEGSEASGEFSRYILQVPLDRVGGRIALNYDLTDRLRFFADIDYADFNSLARGGPARSFFREVINGAENPFVTDEMRALNGGTLGDFSFSRRWDALSESRSFTERAQYQATIGLDGTFNLSSFDRDVDWEIYYSRGESEQRRSSRDRYLTTGPFGLQTVLDAVADPVTGEPICRIALTDPTTSCVPVNPFLGTTDMSPESLAFMRHNTSPSETILEQQVVSGHMTGDLFELPAGMIQAALGFEYRDESVRVGAIPEFDPDSPLFRPELERTEDVLEGGYDVTEFFVEARVPLLVDKPFAQELALEAAARWSDYSHAGNATAYKYSIDWAPIEDIRFRSSYSRAVRAPNVNEAFVQATESFAWKVDPCHHAVLTEELPFMEANLAANREANCAQLGLYPSLPDGSPDPRIPAEYVDNPYDFFDSRWFRPGHITTGNPNLEEEKADTFTAGVVLRPRMIDNFFLTIDYFQIDMEESIASFGFQSILDKCVDSPTLDNPFCANQVRDSNGILTQITSQMLNVGLIEIRGVDIEARYTTDLDRFGLNTGGTITFNPIVTRMLTRDVTVDPNFPDEKAITVGTFGSEQGGSPRWRGRFRTSLEFENVRFDWNIRTMEGLRPIWADEPGEISHDAPSVTYHDFNISANLFENYTIFGGVNNAFDKGPPAYPGLYFGGIESTERGGCGCSNYDINGATYYVGVRATFD